MSELDQESKTLKDVVLDQIVEELRRHIDAAKAAGVEGERQLALAHQAQERMLAVPTLSPTELQAIFNGPSGPATPAVA